MVANSGNQKPQPTASKQNPPPHNRKTTKTPPPTPPQQQQKSKSHRNQNRTEREIGLWVSSEVKGFGSKIGGSKALGSWRDLGSGRVGEVKDWFVGSWHEVSGLPTKSKLVGRRRWALSLSLRAGAISLTLSLSVFQKMIFEGKIKTEIILHPTHGQTEKHFRKMYFPCATKHPHLWKSISENHFHPIQTQP